MSEIRYGQKVWFKSDIEGQGVIIAGPDADGDYLIAESNESVGSGDKYQWHPQAQYSHRFRCMVVYTKKFWI